MTERFDVIGIGTSGMDIVSTPEGVIKSPGGAIANSIVALTRLGLKTGYIGRVGKDRYGKIIVSAFKGEGINIRRLRITEPPTAQFLITVTPQKRILHGARLYTPIKNFSGEDRRYVKKSKSLLFRAKLELLEFYLSLPKKIPLYLVFHDIKTISIGLIMKARPRVFFSNEEEFRIFKKNVGRLRKRGITTVVTRGKRGCRIYSPGSIRDYKPYPVAAMDPTGAGDAFAAGFIFGDLRGWEEKEKASFANAMGALSTTVYGARGNLPTLSKVRKFMEEYESI